jgi:hypothetical protein
VNKVGKKLSVLISSCDSYSDLWDAHLKLYSKNWQDNKYKTYLVTDKETNVLLEGIEIIVAEENLDFPMRIKYALDFIDTPYVLLTLDDYFLIHPVDNLHFDYLVNRSLNEKIDYLMLYDRRFTNERQYKQIEHLDIIDLSKKYALTLYPAIWSTDFLRKTVKSNMSPWHYEVSLTQTAINENANCQFSQGGTFRILDVIRKGKVLRKASNFLIKHNIDIGDRPIIKRQTEIKLLIMDFVSWYSPRWLFLLIKNIAKRVGIKFYSEN